MSETTSCHCIECKSNPRLRKKTPQEEEILRTLRKTEEERLQEIAYREKQILMIEKMKKDGIDTKLPSWSQ